MNFSVVLIARNESKTLPRLIGSLKEFQEKGGEIVVLDTGSTDGTPDIARSLGCKVEEVGDRFRRVITDDEVHDINGFLRDEKDPEIVQHGDSLFDFASARNYAASLASNDMVAMPDCDEIYTKLDLCTVSNVIAHGTEQLEYQFVFAHDETGKPLVQFLHSKFYNRTRLKWVGIIHEVLQAIDPKRQTDRAYLEESIIKLEHFQNHETNRSGYLKGLALAVHLDPKNDRNLHYLGRELLYTGRPHSAIKVLRDHVAMGRWPEERSQSLVHIGEALMQIGKRQEAVHTWIDAFDVCPTRREPFMKIAEFYMASKAWLQAISYLAGAMAINRNSFYASFQPYYEHLPHEMLYSAWWEIGNKVRSAAHFNACIEMQPFNSKYLHDARNYWELPLVSIIIPTLRPEGLERLLKSIENLNYPKDKIETIILKDDPRIGVPKRVKEGVEKSKGEWIVYAADDMEFHPDCIIAAYQQHRLGGEDNNKALIAFNGGPVSPDNGNICEHFMIHRIALEMGELNGEIFDTEFHHVGVDNLLWAIMDKAGEAVRCEHAKYTHHHFSRGSEMDEIHKIGWNEENVRSDRELLKKKLEKI